MIRFLFDPTSGEDWELWLDNHAADIIAISLVVIALHFGLRLFVGRVLRMIVQKAAVRRVVRTGQRGQIEAVERRANTLVSIVAWFVGVFMGFLWLVLLLDEFGHNVNALIAGLGVVGIGVGLAAQQLIRDFINGMLILLEDQYSIGDVIQVAGVSGVVEDINPRRTIIRDLDGAVHVVPNGLIDVTTNFTEGFGRINIDMRVGYDEDIERVIDVINDECEIFAQDHADRVLTTPSVLRVNDLTPSSIDIKILADVKAGEQWSLQGALRQALKRRFDREGIEIPYPYQINVTKNDKAKEQVEKLPQQAGAGEQE